MSRRPTRRRFLESIGTVGGTVTLAGCTAYAGGDRPPVTESGTERWTSTATPTDAGTPTDGGKPPENGAVVFVYDDGRTEDYTKVLPVHREFDAPATTGIVSGNVGRTYYMDVEQIRELAEAGWEIASHTVSHTPVGSYELVEPVESDDVHLYASGVRHGHHEGTTLEITDGDRSVRRTIEGLERDGDTRCIVLADSVGEAFAAGETVVRFPPDFVEESLSKSKRDLEGMGFQVDSLLAPYDNFDEYSMRFVPEYYDYVANARPGSRINRAEGFDPHWTRRDYYIEYTTPDSVEADLDEISGTGALGVFGAHPIKEVVTEARIRETLEMVESRRIEVMTLREACRRYASGA